MVFYLSFSTFKVTTHSFVKISLTIYCKDEYMKRDPPLVFKYRFFIKKTYFFIFVVFKF